MILALVALTSKARTCLRPERFTVRLLIQPREVFKAALLCNAVSVVLAHNHPSGDAVSNVEDVKITRELQRAAELIEIPIMDHIVLGEPDTY